MSIERNRSNRLTHPELDVMVFPPEKIEKIKLMGEKLVSPFWVLSKLDINYPKEHHDLIIGLISQSDYGNDVHFQDTPKGVRIYANNIDPLIRAIGPIFLSRTDLLPKKTQDTINNIFSPKKAALDWQK